MFLEILRFELRQQLRSPLLWVFALVFAAIGFGIMSSDAVHIGTAVGAVHYNAPVVIVNLLGGLTVIAMLFVTTFVASALLRDFDAGTADIMFSTPVSRRAYLGGRFCAGYAAAVIVVVGAMLGMFIGIHMPWVDASRLGPPQPLAYLWGLGVMLLPDMLFVAALLFLLAAATRSLLSTFVGVLAFLVLNVVASRLLAGIDHHVLAAMLDPFGSRTVGVVTRYWTADDYNHRLPPLLGLLGVNRLLWLGIAAALAAAGFALFRPDREGLRLWPRRRHRATAADAADARSRGTLRLPPMPLRDGFGAHLRACLNLARMEATTVVRSVAFLVMLGLALCLLLVGLMFGAQMYGTPVYPVTRVMVQAMHGAVPLPLWIVMSFYAGQLAWRARDRGIAEVLDALPTPGWVPLVSKVIALALVALVFELVATLFCIGYQLVHGFTHVQLLLYAEALLLQLPTFVLIGVLALVLQVLANQRFLGYLLIVLFFISTIVMGVLHWDDNLYQYASNPGAPYSDMNGWGHFLKGVLWFQLYWALCALVLLALARLFLVRGTDVRWRTRLRAARNSLRSRPLLATLLLGLAGFAACGSWIYYNTHVLNHYQTVDQSKRQRADYEKRYAKFVDAAQPRITAVHTDVAIYPYQRRLRVDATYTLTNRSKQPIRDLYVNWNTDVPPQFTLPPHRVVKVDHEVGFSIFRLDQPLAPGMSMTMGFRLRDVHRGFRNDAADTLLVHNGTFFTNKELFPSIGYNRDFQLTSKSDRRKYGLNPKVPRMAALGDPRAAQHNYISQDADWVDFDATVSTAGDQIALAPGYLVKSWRKDGRRYFHYVMDKPILNFFAFLSARWKVRRDHWHNVDLDVYYDPAHPWNVEDMIDAAKKALSYYSSHYSPYQYRQLRILEFPGYRSFAQSFANTVPYSESIGFIADVKGKGAIDYPFYVTAHEVAHQWWGHQVVGADEQGATMLSESLAQYSALMVMKHTYGADKMHRFLAYELDHYLMGRLTDSSGEQPLAKVENQQYIHYRKGSLVFYALQDYLGEDTVDRALSQFVAAHAFKPAPYPTSRELIDTISKQAGPQWQNLIQDLFWKITLFDNRIDKAEAHKLADGRYRVTLTLHAAKYYADKNGHQTRAKVDIPIEVGVFGASRDGIAADGKPLYLAKRDLSDGDSTVTVTVDGKPAAAGIDPFNELIDRKSADNVRKVVIH